MELDQVNMNLGIQVEILDIYLYYKKMDMIQK